MRLAVTFLRASGIQTTTSSAALDDERSSIVRPLTDGGRCLLLLESPLCFLERVAEVLAELLVEMEQMHNIMHSSAASVLHKKDLHNNRVCLIRAALQ